MQTKECKECKKTKPISEFGKHLKCRLGVRNKCKKCYSEKSIKYQKDHYEDRKKYINEWRKNNKNKIDKQSREYRDIKNAARRKKYKQDEEYRERQKSKAKEWQTKNQEKRKEQRLKSTYGITLTQFNELLKNANSQCEICGYSDMSDKKIFPLVDHCHDSGKIRGILCANCNHGLGKFKDNIYLLKKTINYLERQ